MTYPALTPQQVAELDQSIALFERMVDKLVDGVPDVIDRFGRERAVATLYTGLSAEAPGRVASIAAVALVRLHEQAATGSADSGRSS